MYESDDVTELCDDNINDLVQSTKRREDGKKRKSIEKRVEKSGDGSRGRKKGRRER